MITFNEFLDKVDKIHSYYCFELRYGQTIMNVLRDVWLDKYSELVATSNDCYYDDRLVENTLNKLKNEWNDEC